MKLKPVDIEQILQALVAEGEVSRAALKVLTMSGHNANAFAPLFRAEVAAVLARANREEPRERRLCDLIEAARDRLLDAKSTNVALH